jgi:hypothetical protein
VINSKPQTRKGDGAWTGKVIQIALYPGAFSGTPRKVRVFLSRQRSTLERTVMECFQERLGGIKYLVVIHDLDYQISSRHHKRVNTNLELLPLRCVCTTDVDILIEIQRVQKGSWDITTPTEPQATEGSIKAERTAPSGYEGVIWKPSSLTTK